MPEVKNVGFGKPKTSGSVYAAPVGTELPTDATTPLNEAFKELGYASEDGLVNENTPDSDIIKAWGGDTVLVVQSSKEDTFKIKFIESLNVETLKTVYGDGNVEGTLETGITLKANANDVPEKSLVFETVIKDAVKRIVIPQAKLKELGEIAYTDEDALGYETTFQALPDSKGNTHYEYIQKAS